MIYTWNIYVKKPFIFSGQYRAGGIKYLWHMAQVQFSLRLEDWERLEMNVWFWKHWCISLSGFQFSSFWCNLTLPCMCSEITDLCRSETYIFNGIMVNYGNKSIHFPSKSMKFKQKMSFKILTNVCGEDGVSSNIKMQILAEYFSPEALVFIVTMNSSKASWSRGSSSRW